ncbi:DNA topoisomerase IV [Flavobacteriaceae bacterium]|nr:DNA topoisomerase IV [Flavobacteriaceae bacterium]
MKYLYFLCFLCFSSCYQIERNCQNFKTGTFQSTISIDGTTYTSEFTRTEKLQIERFNTKTDSASVRWINDCEMIFKTINPKNRAEQKDVHLKILTTTKDTYRFEYGYVGSSIKQKGEAKRID